MAGRFNKILEFIGLVDDEPEEDLDQGRRPVGGQTYGGVQSRRTAPQSAPRYDERPNSGARYSSTRPDYDARQRRSEPQFAPRYGSDYRTDSRYDSRSDSRSDSRTDYRSEPRSDYRAESRSDYRGASASPRGDYARSGQARDHGASQSYRQQSRPDPLEAEFERAGARSSREDDRQRPNVVPLRAAEHNHQTVIYYLRQLEDCRDVINDLLDNKTVLLNLEDMDERVEQRSIDTLCGAAFALGATLRKASGKTYLIAPKSVDVASTKETAERHF